MSILQELRRCGRSIASLAQLMLAQQLWASQQETASSSEQGGGRAASRLCFRPDHV